MKKLKKCLSAILAGMISVSLLGSLAVNAETTDTEKKIYTLSELFEMSEEEFFALDSFELNPSPAYQHKVVTPKMIYDEINLAMDGYNFFGNMFTCRYRKYVPYYTEKEIMRLLDVDDIDFVVESSVTTDLYGNSIDHTIWVHDRFYSRDFTKLEIAKIRYCLYQVMQFYHVSYVLDSAYSTGDVNEDGEFTAMDAAFLARKLAEQKVDELPETADVNGDGEITALDCAEIARFLAAKAMSKAEGMFVEQQ